MNGMRLGICSPFFLLSGGRVDCVVEIVLQTEVWNVNCQPHPQHISPDLSNWANPFFRHRSNFEHTQKNKQKKELHQGKNDKVEEGEGEEEEGEGESYNYNTYQVGISMQVVYQIPSVVPTKINKREAFPFQS
ncbi:hypothetical protein TWF132_002225 [Orbilia oligospora]|nr:hypothetical protein TWF132_002225 [Orbilia oligospora]